MKFMPSRLWSSRPGSATSSEQPLANDSADPDLVGNHTRGVGPAVRCDDRYGETQALRIVAGPRRIGRCQHGGSRARVDHGVDRHAVHRERSGEMSVEALLQRHGRTAVAVDNR